MVGSAHTAKTRQNREKTTILTSGAQLFLFVGRGHELDIRFNNSGYLWTSHLDSPESHWTSTRRNTHEAAPYRSALRLLPRRSPAPATPSTAALSPCPPAATLSSQLAGRIDVDGDPDLPSPTTPHSHIRRSQRRLKSTRPLLL
jgi:hypothetical protein